MLSHGPTGLMLESLIPCLRLSQLALKFGNALSGALGFFRATGDCLVSPTSDALNVALSGCQSLPAVADDAIDDGRVLCFGLLSDLADNSCMLGFCLLGLGAELDANMVGILLRHGRPVLKLQGDVRIHPNLDLCQLVGGCVDVHELKIVLLVELSIDRHVLLYNVCPTDVRGVHIVVVARGWRLLANVRKRLSHLPELTRSRSQRNWASVLSSLDGCRASSRAIRDGTLPHGGRSSRTAVVPQRRVSSRLRRRY